MRTEDYGNDKGRFPWGTKGTKEIAGWCYNQGIHGEAKSPMRSPKIFQSCEPYMMEAITTEYEPRLVECLMERIEE